MTCTIRIFALLALLAALPASAGAATLKDQATVDGDVVRLGDVLHGVGAAGSHVIAAAPAPGERMTLSAYDIRSAAADAGLKDAETAIRGYVEVRRAGRAVPEDLIRDRLRDALAADGETGPFELRLSGLREPPQIAPGLAPEDLEIAIVDFTPRSGRLTAELTLPTADGTGRRMDIRAVATAMQHVPVLIEDMAKDAVIREDDITWATVESRRINRTMITDAGDLVGKAVRRRLQGGRPLRLSDVQRPVLVERGGHVTMAVTEGPLRLTALGKAMENGARNDIIRLTNTASGRIVEARVTGAGKVAVLSAGGMTLSQR